MNNKLKYIAMLFFLGLLYFSGVSLEHIALIGVIIAVFSLFRRGLYSYMHNTLLKFKHYRNAHPWIQKVALLIIVIAAYVAIKEAAYIMAYYAFGFDVQEFYMQLFEAS